MNDETPIPPGYVRIVIDDVHGRRSLDCPVVEMQPHPDEPTRLIPIQPEAI